ncbi:hypothetical protein [Ramlibacter rhizophilus]|uniref:Uncharacterized protein n=1 Tax=Ramlibacter rhizophilus TaxID=1781167 RepID=A0A4Z0BQ11_9BURK|nr:hypothetical protein [Ramlibacter rhizophilus]TFZ01377.1 hypothetical protein EZ242_08335 [Ramlibacter rhizophilus]
MSAARSPSPFAPLGHTVGIVLIALLALAFYLVCSHQVRTAEARRITLQVQQAAFSDCLQYVVGSTIGACTSRLGAQPAGATELPADAPQLVVGR